MSYQKRLQFVQAQTAVLAAIVICLTLLDALTMDLFLIFGVVGLLFVFEYTAPITVTPRWRIRIRWILAVGLLLVAYLLLRRIATIVAPVLL